MPKKLPSDKIPLPGGYSEKTKNLCERHVAMIAMHRIERLCEQGLLDVCDTEQQLNHDIPCDRLPRWRDLVPEGITCDRLYSLELDVCAQIRMSLNKVRRQMRDGIDFYRRTCESDVLP